MDGPHVIDMTEKTVNYLERAIIIHKNKYDYSKVENITTNKQYIDIICPIHGVFSQAVSCHINAKQGCPRCGGNYKKTTEEVKSEIYKVHKDKFTYEEFDYKSNKQKIGIFCKEHGRFEQGVKEHINGGGCPKCAKNCKSNTDDFIQKVVNKFGESYLERYDYSEVDYTGTDKEITIICKSHGKFSTTPHKHLMGYGCTRCVANSSKIENIWLDSLNIPHLKRQHRIDLSIGARIVDGFDPHTNTVYELHGDFFHGNPQYFLPNDINPVSKVSFGGLYQKTKEKEYAFKNEGYKYVYVWESDIKRNLGLKADLKYKALIDEWVQTVNHRRQYERLWLYADGEDYDWDRMMKIHQS